MRIAHVCCLSLLMAPPLWAQTDAPISAIDWLSQPGLAPLTEEPLVVGDPTRGAELTEIDVVELDAPVEKTYGLIPSKISGIPENFWTDLDPRMLRQILNAAPLSGLPAADDLMLRALLAETLGAETILNIRVQALIERGATHAAYSLLGAGSNSITGKFWAFCRNRAADWQCGSDVPPAQPIATFIRQ